MNTEPFQWIIIAGEHHKYETGHELSFEVSDIIVHPLYSEMTFDNDLALMRLSSSSGGFPCDNIHIQPVIFPPSSKLSKHMNYEMCFASFGDVFLNGWLAW